MLTESFTPNTAEEVEEYVGNEEVNSVESNSYSPESLKEYADTIIDFAKNMNRDQAVALFKDLSKKFADLLGREGEQVVAVEQPVESSVAVEAVDNGAELSNEMEEGASDEVLTEGLSEESEVSLEGEPVAMEAEAVKGGVIAEDMLTLAEEGLKGGESEPVAMEADVVKGEVIAEDMLTLAEELFEAEEDLKDGVELEKNESEPTVVGDSSTESVDVEADITEVEKEAGGVFEETLESETSELGTEQEFGVVEDEEMDEVPAESIDLQSKYQEQKEKEPPTLIEALTAFESKVGNFNQKALDFAKAYIREYTRSFDTKRSNTAAELYAVVLKLEDKSTKMDTNDMYSCFSKIKKVVKEETLGGYK